LSEKQIIKHGAVAKNQRTQKSLTSFDSFRVDKKTEAVAAVAVTAAVDTVVSVAVLIARNAVNIVRRGTYQRVASTALLFNSF